MPTMNRMSFLTRLLPLAFVIAIANGAHAHEPMVHGCEAPVRPANDQDDQLWQAFLDEIDAYRACVEAAKIHHEAAARKHQEAAKDAVEAWNGFVRSSLNAPEDFPWPPE